MKTTKTSEPRLEISSVFTRWQVHCQRCGAVFYVDMDPQSTEERILELKDVACGLHPNEGSVIELAQ